MATKTTGSTALQKVLAEVAAEAGYVQKDAKNDHHKYKYASADAVLTKVREALASRGAAIINTDVQLAHVEGDRRIVRMQLTVALGDETATFSGFGEGKDGQDKGVMKANTAALKYALAAMLLMSWGDDPEASEPTEAKPKRAPAEKQAPASTAGGEAIIAKMTADTVGKAKSALKAFMSKEGISGKARDELVAAFQAKAKSFG